MAGKEAKRTLITQKQVLSAGLRPLEPMDINKISDFDDLAKAMAKTSFNGRRVGEAVEVLCEMVADPECFVVATFSGAMTVAQMGLLICEMIDRKMINAVVTTGALMTHGLVEAMGMTHFKCSANLDDTELFVKGFDRIYDTIELEKNLDDLQLILDNVFQTFNRRFTYHSQLICQEVGKYLVENVPGRGILKSAHEQKVPVFIPAFTDSEFGLDFAIFNSKEEMAGRKKLRFDPYYDLESFRSLIEKQKKLGIFTIGGGVPRNWAQQVAPYLDIRKKRLGVGKGFKSYSRAVRICPEPVEWGGLSGCTYSEGVSWGKFVSPQKGGKYAEVLADATIAWPIILQAAIQRLSK